MRTLLALMLVLLGALATTLPAYAVRPDEMLADPALEARARAVSEGLRCLVCQNQSIEESDADLAHDLRVIVRERIQAGDTNQQAIDFVVARYGEYVLLNPVVAPHTILLWIAAPVALVLGGGVILFAVRRRRSNAAPAPTSLSAEEARTIEELRGP